MTPAAAGKTGPMSFRDLGPLRLLEFESLSGNGLIQGAFTRRGGVSPAPWASLNVGGTVGDEAGRVRENRRQMLAAVGLSLESVFDVWQVHSGVVVAADGPRGDEPLTQADAIVTDVAGVTLMMRFADCVPILLYDPVQRAIGLAHAGWLGTVRQIARKAVREMVERYGSRPADLIAALGPSIAAHHYPVGPEVVAAVRESLGEGAAAHLELSDEGARLDLWSANVALLRDAGVEDIEVSGLCTACETRDWYSHRAEQGHTGRFGAIVALTG